MNWQKNTLRWEVHLRKLFFQSTAFADITMLSHCKFLYNIFIFSYVSFNKPIELIKDKGYNVTKRRNFFIMYIAHKSTDNPSIEQELRLHCENTAQYALERVCMVEFEHTIQLAGWLHDLGKMSDAYQEYIRKAADGENVRRGSVTHTFAGVIYILEKYHSDNNSKYEKRTSELIAYAVGAHHGLFDAISCTDENGFEHRLQCEKESIQYEEVIERFLKHCLSEKQIEKEFYLAVVEVERFFEKTIDNCNHWHHSAVKHKDYNPRVEMCYVWGLLIRMVTSAVMYGDRTDTAEFMQGISHENNVVSASFWEEQLAFMEDQLNEKNKKSDNTQLNRERQKISDACKAFAKQGNGIYKLSVPTGAGKTLSTIRYAYTIAELERKQRVIFVIPLLSVLEQNAEEIRKYTKEKNFIGEHHSNIVQANDTEEQLNKSHLLAEFWDEPIIITTLYQLLMNMFSEKTSYITRYSALVNSVIVIDEAQSIPLRDTHMFDLAVNFMRDFFHTTVVLCSATQPTFENAMYPIRFTQPIQMIAQSEERKNIFKRVSVHNMVDPHGMSNAEIVEFCIDKMEKMRSLLVICNTRDQARKLYQEMSYHRNEDLIIFHLSTSMCLQHRRDVLDEINECLSAKSGKKMICVSTQLVEAGIDFSFESVVRSLAGIDNIVQAFGRCNRSFEYGKTSDAYIIRMKEENLTNLKEIKEAQKSTESLLEAFENNPDRFDNDILSDKSIQFYYEALFTAYMADKGKLDYEISLSESMGKDTIFNLLSLNEKTNVKKDSKYFTQQAFLTAGRYFQVFNSETVDVITPYKEGKDIIVELCSGRAKYDIKYRKELLKKAGEYSIQIWKNQLNDLINDGIILPVLGENGDYVLFYQLSNQNYTDIGYTKENNFV